MSRTERYRKRCGDEGNPTVDESNPLPRLIDPVTLEPVVTPAISPWGHVMGMATWKVHRFPRLCCFDVDSLLAQVGPKD